MGRERKTGKGMGRGGREGRGRDGKGWHPPNILLHPQLQFSINIPGPIHTSQVIVCLPANAWPLVLWLLLANVKKSSGFDVGKTEGNRFICENNNNNNIRISIAPYGRNFRGVGDI